MDADVVITSVRTDETRNGNTRWTVTDDGGGEYTTFRPAIGQSAQKAEGSRARISFHEEDRNGFHNVYLDAIGPAGEARQDQPDATDPDEVAWNTAVETAPWMLGSREPEEEIPPEELYEKLEPFKRLVAEDIREGTGDDGD